MDHTYEKNQMLGLLYRIFQAEEYQWYGYGKMYVPSFKEIEQAVENLERSALDYNGVAESGRIRVCYDKETQTFEYYLNLGG